MSGTDLVLLVAGLLLGGALVALLLRARGGEGALAQHVAGLAERLGQVRGDLDTLLRQQEGLRGEVAAVREQGQAALHQTHLSLRAEITQARELLAKIQAADTEREKAEREAYEALKRLEGILAGTKARGEAGENLLGRILLQLPPDLREENCVIGNKTVEFALRLPQGRLLPIDSKWPSLSALEEWQAAEDPAQRKRLAEAIQRDVKGKVREAVKYLDPSRTLGIGVVALPDPVYEVCGEVHGEAFKQGIILIPYSQAVPFLLALFMVILRYATSVDTARLSSALKTILDSLEQMEGEVDGRFANALTQLRNSREALLAQLEKARRGAGSLHVEGEGPPSLPPAPGS
jgi:DNA recombination protein RmuC